MSTLWRLSRDLADVIEETKTLNDLYEKYKDKMSEFPAEVQRKLTTFFDRYSKARAIPLKLTRSAANDFTHVPPHCYFVHEIVFIMGILPSSYRLQFLLKGRLMKEVESGMASEIGIGHPKLTLEEPVLFDEVVAHNLNVHHMSVPVFLLFEPQKFAQ
jgi:hypothetical protein